MGTSRNRTPMPARPEGRKVVEILDLSVLRGERRILHGVSWTIRRGEHWAVVGPNGCGKTSLLKALTGYLTPSCGSIQLLNHRFGETDWRELRKRTGLVSSGIARMMSPEDTALEIVCGGADSMIGSWGRIPPARRSLAIRWLRRCEAAELAGSPWAILSQGERQRVLIARAQMAKPAILLLDEPCAGLDPVARCRFLEFLQSLARARRGPSIVLITHHVEEILPLFSHALVLARGTVVASGPIRRSLTAKALGRAFGEPLEVRRRGGGWSLVLRRRRPPAGNQG